MTEEGIWGCGIRRFSAAMPIGSLSPINRWASVAEKSMTMGFDRNVEYELELFLGKYSKTNYPGRKLAVFDADGTLWEGDLGESFFRDQIKKKQLSSLPSNIDDPWGHYQNEVLNGDPAKAFGWLAQWNAGVLESDLTRWAEEFFEEHYLINVFEPMRILSHALLNSGFEIWVVTGSLRWVAQVGVKGFGIQSDRIIGSSVKIDAHGCLTSEIEYEVPYRQSKAKLIESKIGTKPIFAAGNTHWDNEMLELSQGLVLTICSEQSGGPSFDSEQKLKKIAKEKNISKVIWLSQEFKARS